MQWSGADFTRSSHQEDGSWQQPFGHRLSPSKTIWVSSQTELLMCNRVVLKVLSMGHSREYFSMVCSNSLKSMEESLFLNHRPGSDWQPPNPYLEEPGINSGLIKWRGAGRKWDNLQLKTLSLRFPKGHNSYPRVRMELSTNMLWFPECTLSRNPNMRRSETEQATWKPYFLSA